MESLSSSEPYELSIPAVQKPGTKQCTWLALLEVLRSSGRLDETFTVKGGKLHTYYDAKGRRIPDEGELPSNPIPPNPTAKTDRNLLVYGPMWQRMIMYFLLDGDNKFCWYMPTVTIATPKRPEELVSLMDNLGVAGVTFGKPFAMVPIFLSKTVKDLPVGKRLLVDKKGPDGSGHSMAGVVESVEPMEPKGRAYKRIRVYNQSTGDTLTYCVEKVGDKMTLISEPRKGSTTRYIIDWFMTVNFDAPKL